MKQNWDALVDKLAQDIGRFGRVAVAFSGGVDSSLVAAVAYRALGEAAVAVTATSPSLASGELDQARLTARHIGIQHDIVETAEADDPRYLQNPVNRCYFCKHHLYDTLRARYGEETTLLSGTNHDDLDDWRPGMRAAYEHNVHHPLSDARVSKQQVRELASLLGLPNAEKPASPCLASRIPYGTPVTVELLGRIDRAETNVRRLGFKEFRVRDHGMSATVELSSEDLSRFTSQSPGAITSAVRDAGYPACRVSHEPLRSGSLNIGISTPRREA